MAVRSSITHKKDIPHETGEWMEFKELGWRTFQAAREARSRQALVNFRDLGPEFLKSMQQTPSEPTEEAPAKKEDLADTFDMGMLLRASITAWSYDVPCTEANIDELDEKTAAWALKMIDEIHFPSEEEVGKVIEP